jgi:hypothetical protein
MKDLILAACTMVTWREVMSERMMMAIRKKERRQNHAARESERETEKLSPISTQHASKKKNRFTVKKGNGDVSEESITKQ